MNPRSRSHLALGVVLSLLVCPGLARATPVVAMNWGLDCSNGPLDTSGLGLAPLTTWVLGQDQPQRACELRFVVRRALAGGVPDASRFDAAGCASDRMAFEWRNP